MSLFRARPRPRTAALPFALALAAVPLLQAPGVAQAASAAERAFHEAYYLENEGQDLARALELYRRVAGDESAPADLRAKAQSHARGVGEEIACSDFTRLAPASSIFYLELNRPGEQLGGLLGQLGLLTDPTDPVDGGAPSPGISPRLLEGALGVRGAAVAITEFDPRRGPTNGVAILHPGDMDLVRGLLETALPAGGQAVEPIDGYPTFDIEGKALVTITSRLLIASATREPIADVLARTRGEGSPSLADSEAMAGAMKARGDGRDDLLFFAVHCEPLMPMLRQHVEHATRREPQLRAALALLDLDSTRSLAGRAGVDGSGVSLELAFDLAEDHRNLVFDLLRLPAMRKSSLEIVPDGVAFFAAGSLNPDGVVPPGLTKGRGEPAVTLMDFGRELFANVADFAVYAMPRVMRTPGGPMPEMALAMRVNDPERSLALWRFVLRTAQAATGGGAAVEAGDPAAGAVERYRIEGVPVFLAASGRDLFVSPSEGAISAAVEARSKGRSVLDDAAYGDVLARLEDGRVRTAAVNVGRLCEIATHFMGERERREMAPIAQVSSDTSVVLGVRHTSSRLAVAARITGLPDLGPIVTELVRRRAGRAGEARVSGSSSARPRSESAPVPARGSAIRL